jgi:transcription factor SFP1
MSSSVDSDRGSLINAFNVFDREGELCRNYTCCGLHLQDLHALLEHFEEVHILVVDPNAPAQIHIPFNPQCISTQQQPQHNQQHQSSHHHQQHQQQLPQQQRPTFDSSDDMEFELELDSSAQSVPPTPAATSSRSSPSSAAPTPPHTPISAPLSAYPSPTTAAAPSLAYLQPQSQYHGMGHQVQGSQFNQYQTTPYTSAHTSPYTSEPPSPGALSVNPHPIHSHLGPFPHHHQQQPNVVAHPEEAFNTYARFSSDYSSHLPGAQYNGASGDDQVVVSPEYTGATVVGEYSSPVSPQGYLGQAQGIDVQQQQAPAPQQGPQCIPPALLFGNGERKTENGVRRDVHAARPRSGVSSPQPLQKVRLKIRGLGGGELATRSTPTTPTTLSPSHTPNPSLSSAGASSSSTIPRDGQNQVQVSTSSLLLSKPFRCPKPNCNKSYKQANGLKYHMTHGSCNFAPPKDLEHMKDLLERKRREREAREGVSASGESNVKTETGTGLSRSASVGSIGTKVNGNTSNSGSPPSTSATSNANPSGNNNDAYYSDLAALGSITETELREVEKEAEKRLRPFACGVGDCQRRYKNMNGLRYHYQVCLLFR